MSWNETDIKITLWKALIRHPDAVYQMTHGLQTNKIHGRLTEEAYLDLKKFIHENILELKVPVKVLFGLLEISDSQ